MRVHELPVSYEEEPRLLVEGSGVELVAATVSRRTWFAFKWGSMGNKCPARRVGHSLPVGNTVNRLLTGKLRRNRGSAYPCHSMCP